MERWQRRVVEAVYAAAQGKKAEAVARLHRLELLFRKTGHVAGEITATGCRGLVQASIAMNDQAALAARQLLMRSVYLAQEQKQQAEEVAAAVADKCALMLSRVVGMEVEEAVGWFRLQRAPEMAVPRFRLKLVRNILRDPKLGFLIHEAHMQMQEAAREVMRDIDPQLVRDILFIYERVAEAADARRQQLSVDIYREALALLGSSSSRCAGLLHVGERLEWQRWARRREEEIWYRMGRLLVQLRPKDNDANLAAEALAMLANSLQYALQDDGWKDEECVSFHPDLRDGRSYAELSDDERCVSRRANAHWCARHLTDQIVRGQCPPKDFAGRANCCVMTHWVWMPPISRSQAVKCVEDAVLALAPFPQWKAEVMGHMEAVTAQRKLSQPEAIRRLEAVRADALLQMGIMEGASGRDERLAGQLRGREDFRKGFLELQREMLARTCSEVAHDSSKAAQMYELCRDMATGLHICLSMQLRAAEVWRKAGELLPAKEAVLEAFEFLLHFEHAEHAFNSEAMSMSWGLPAAADSSLEVSRAGLLATAASLILRLWEHHFPAGYAHDKLMLKVALEALWELCRLPANDLDVYLKHPGIAYCLMTLVDVYREDNKWAAAEQVLGALAPRLKDTPLWRRDLQLLDAVGLSHSRHYLQAAVTLEEALSAVLDPDDDAAFDYCISAHSNNTYLYAHVWGAAIDYCRAGQHHLAEKLLSRLERKIQAKTWWPPPRPGDDGVGRKQHLESQLCSAQAWVASSAKRFDQALSRYRKAASLQEAIISDIRQRQLPVAKYVRELATTLIHEASMMMQLGLPKYKRGLQLATTLTCEAHVIMMDDMNGLEARIERLETLGVGGLESALCGLLRAEVKFFRSPHRKEVEGIAEQARQVFLRTAERQEGQGGDDDDSWITGYNHGVDSMAHLLERIHLGILGEPRKALLWAERGRMRLFMRRVRAQQQEDDPEPAMDSTHNNDFDRDDGKALDMLLKVLLACGPNVALIEYSFAGLAAQELHIYAMFGSAADPTRFDCTTQVVDSAGIEPLVKKARDSIITGTTPAAHKRNRQALAKLHRLLVAPVQDKLHKFDTLIFVPEGCLSLVPFAALYDQSAGQFLIQQKQVVVAPCLRALSRCLGLQDRFLSSAMASTMQQPFVAGNPIPMGLGLPQLPHAEEEAAAVADILGVKPCLGAAVTKEAVVEALCHSSVVVLASHAIVGGHKFPAGALVLQGPSLTHDPDMASSSSTRASTSAASNYDPALLRAMMMDPDSDEPEADLLTRGLQASVTDKSQVLTADELSGMRIPAGLVVLSACETGRGEVTPEGVLGLGRALLQAGAATTVLSLWKVDDQATKRLITEMFQELQKGEPVGTALRKAMLKMIQEGSSISQWAPFFIFGSPTMHLRNVTTLKGKKKTNGSSPELDLELGQMNGSSPKLELGDGMQQVLRPTSDATSSASSASDQATVQAILVGTHESAWLDSSTGAICRRLFPRGLNITWGDAEQYWTWRTLDSSTNSHEVAVLKQVCWLDLRGRIKGTLTPGTVYTLSWRIRFALAPFTRGFNEHPVRFFLDTSDGQHHVVDAFLNSSSSRADPRSRVNILWGEDGWHEYEVADFSVPAAAHGQDELEVAFGMWEHSGNWKCGLYVDSVVLRPRQAPSRKDAP